MADGKGLRDPAEIARRLARLHEPHVAPLTALVERIRSAFPWLTVPWFDPNDGGTAASILVLQEAPGRGAADGSAARRRPGSGFVSIDNDDETAAAWLRMEVACGVRREQVARWNICPWYLGTSENIAGASSGDIEAGARWLEELLVLLPALRVVVLAGKAAEAGWRHVRHWDLSLEVLACPHPSPQNLNSRPEARQVIEAAIRQAKVYAEVIACPECGGRPLPIRYGFPSSDLAEGGEVLVGGCVVRAGAPTHGCTNGHRWKVATPLVDLRHQLDLDRRRTLDDLLTRRDAAISTTGGQDTVRRFASFRHEELAELPSDLVERSRRILDVLVAPDAIRISHVSHLADLFDAWAHLHAATEGETLVFTAGPGRGLWMVLHALHPIDDGNRWNSLRRAIVEHLISTGRWRRLGRPNSRRFELLHPGAGGA